MEEKKPIGYAIYQKNRAWKRLETCKSLMLNELERLSNLEECDISHKDLVLLISRCCDYMHSLNLYNYWKRELAGLTVNENE